MTTTAAKLIDLKGVAAVADATGANPETVRVWKHRNRLPRKAWPELMQAFPDVTMAVLLKTEAAV